eukprot:787497-Pelagomonas_calceolata.AAC.1
MHSNHAPRRSCPWAGEVWSSKLLAGNAYTGAASVIITVALRVPDPDLRSPKLTLTFNHRQLLCAHVTQTLKPKRPCPAHVQTFVCMCATGGTRADAPAMIPEPHLPRPSLELAFSSDGLVVDADHGAWVVAPDTRHRA